MFDSTQEGGKRKSRGRSALRMAEFPEGVIYEWGISGDHRSFRLAQANGILRLEERMSVDPDHWIMLQVDSKHDVVMQGIAQLAKRLERAEMAIDLLRREMMKGMVNP